MYSINYSNQDILEMQKPLWYKDIEIIDISSTEIELLPEWIFEISNLRILNLHDTRIANIDKRIGKLKSLEKLDISGTQISCIPDEVKELENLTELYAYDVSIGESDIERFKSAKIAILDISNTKIRGIPDNVWMMKGLKLLNVSKTEIEEISDDISNLSELEMLNISRTKIRSLPHTIYKLQNLQTIDAAYSTLETIPLEIGDVTSLRKLMINNTRVISLPDVFNGLQNLELLDISGLVIDYIPESLTTLPMEFKWWRRRYIDRGIVMSNSISRKMPFSLLMQNRGLLNEYYKSSKTTCNEGKVILLGNGDVGKSYIVERIIKGGRRLNREFEPPITKGVSVRKWHHKSKGSSNIINFWDFGGQEILHSLHKMFLTERSVYVIVLSARHESLQYEAEKWLQIVESLAPTSDVIIVINKMDLNEYASINESALYNLFRNLKIVIKLSALYDEYEEFHRLMEIILEKSNNGMCRMQIPVDWNAIRNEIGKITDKYITKKRFRTICQKNNVFDRNIQEWILSWFRDIGVCFSACIEDIGYGNRIVLDSQWILELIRQIIDVGRRQNSNGNLDINRLSEALDELDEDYEDYAMALAIMRQYNLSYQQSSKIEFIPLLLSKKERVDEIRWCNRASYIIEIRYKYLPITILHQVYISLISRVEIVKDWFSGVRFKYKKTEVELCLKQSENKIELYLENLDANSVQTVRDMMVEVEKVSDRMNKHFEVYIGIKEHGLVDFFSAERIRIMLEHGKKSDFSHVLEHEIDLMTMKWLLPLSTDVKDIGKNIEASGFSQYYNNVGTVINLEGVSNKFLRQEDSIEKSVVDVEAIATRMTDDLKRADMSDAYYTEISNKYRKYGFVRLLVYIDMQQWTKVYTEYLKSLDIHIHDTDNMVSSVMDVNFAFGISIWKYYKTYIFNANNNPLFIYIPLNTRLFPLAIYATTSVEDFEEVELSNILDKYDVISYIKGGEYKDIQFINVYITEKYRVKKEYIHYK